MEERNYLAEALILRARDFKESDKIITFFSREKGKRSAIAKGVRKPKSSLRGVVQPFCHASLALAKGRGSLDVITQGETIDSFAPLREDLDKIAHASYIAELIDAGMPDGKRGEAVFWLALAAFSFMSMSDDLALPTHFFELRFLSQLGLTPRLEACCACGRRVEGASFFLSGMRGGIVCASCHGASAGLIGAGTVQMMRKMREVELPKLLTLRFNSQMEKEMTMAINGYLDYHLDYALKARALLKQLSATEV